MQPPRLTLAGQIGVIVVVAVGFAALRSGSLGWYRTIYSLTILALAVAALAARYRGPFWRGFAVVGWGYFLLGMGPWFIRMEMGGPSVSLNHDLLTSVWIKQLSEHAIAVSDTMPATPEGMAIRAERIRRIGYTTAIAHSLFSLLVATIGGIAAARLEARRSEGPDR